MTWKCHLGEFAKGRYNLILGKYLLTAMLHYIKFSDNVILAAMDLLMDAWNIWFIWEI